MSEVDAVVIGAGAIGLAAARALALAGREIIVLEKNAHIGEETSARNSEVIHAGLYYPAGSLKADLCVEGKRQLYDYCERKSVPHKRCGKLVVAVAAEHQPRLQALQRSAAANGVGDVEWLTAADVQRLEPNVRCSAGLWSPSTGILDSHAFMLALRGDLEQAGGSVAVLSRFQSAVVDRGSLRLRCRAGSEDVEIGARAVVNAAGLHATQVARAMPGLQPEAIPVARYAKGNYFTYAGSSPFSHLVYPLPESGGLGVHATLDLTGRVRFGPDVEWLDAQAAIDDADYAVDPSRAAAFYAAVRTYWPELADGTLQPAYAGIRPKIVGPGEPPADFRIEAAGGPGAREVHLFGIESPGLTSALAIAERVRALLDGTSS
jgi:L-2-hydroxyglutarate oxidase LhgO